MCGGIERLAFKEKHVPLGYLGGEPGNDGLDSGRARSRPVINPPIAGVRGAKAKPRLGAFIISSMAFATACPL